ncbi:MAG: hypothetical protein JW699_04630 [Chitinispirillaceae bacterium]|nr:hypothetical protein [Chitinispirillaceae bacterium]
MNRHLLSFLLGLLVSGLAVFFIMRYQASRGSEVWAAGEFIGVRRSVERRLAEVSQEITARLSAFAEGAASDQLFALRLIAENNPSAPEVAGKAGAFLAPMGFAFLSIVDSAGTILSSGHFPASRGDRIPGELMRKIPEEPKLVEVLAADGKKTLSFQARRVFTVADSITFFALGGAAVDGEFLGRLSPMTGVKVLLRRGSEVAGMENVKTMSEVNDGAVLINGKAYPAFSIALDYAGEGEPPELIGIVMK